MASVCLRISPTTTSVGNRTLAKCGTCTEPLWTRTTMPVCVDLRSGKSWMKSAVGRYQCMRRSSLRPIVRAVHVLHGETALFEDSISTKNALANKPCLRQASEIAVEMLESWVFSSVSEIVRHLPEAPYIQQVFKSKDNIREGERQRVSEELFEKPESWAPVKQGLMETAPDALILVHRLDPASLSEYSNEYGMKDVSEAGALRPGDIRTDVWGVLVQGRNTRCNSCFLLKTTRVSSSVGVLTQFCLSRATCFGPSVKTQLQRIWLL